MPYVAATVKSAQVVELTASEVEAYEASIGKTAAAAAPPPPAPVVEEPVVEEPVVETQPILEPEIGETLIEDFDPSVDEVLGALGED